MILADEAATLALGNAVGAVLRRGDVVTLSGSLGAGKTVLARGILRGLGFAGDVPSPSFPIVIGYAPPDIRLALAHVDLYRVTSGVEELGLDEARAEGAMIVEWPERIGAGYWYDALALALAVGEDASRCLTAHVPPAWERRWPPR